MLRYLAALLLYLVATAAWSLPAPVSVGLSPGWNPVAFQCSQVTSLQGDVAALAVYEGGQYRLGAFTLEEINRGAGTRRGFYVFARAATTLTYQGEDNPRPDPLDLVTGWNLVGTATNREVIPQSSSLPLFYDGNTQLAAGAPLPPGKALWAFASTAGRLTLSPVLNAVRLELSPATFSLQRYGTRQLTVLAVLADGTHQDVTDQVDWVSSVPSAAAVGPTGLLTALFPTTVTVTARFQGLESALEVTVTDFATAGPNPTPTPRVATGFYVSNFGANTIVKVDLAGAVTAFVASGGSPALAGARGMSTDSTGNLFICSQTSNQILKITPAGAKSVFVPSGGSPALNGPATLTVDAADNLYVANFNGNNILKVTPGGVVSTAFDGASTPASTGPAGVVLDALGNLFVSRATSNSVVKYPLAGGAGSFLTATGLSTPQGGVFDDAGNLYVANSGSGALVKITPAGVTTTLVAGLSFPSAVVFTGGDLYVVEATANRVRKVTLAGVATIFATSGLFSTPLGITLAY